MAEKGMKIKLNIENKEILNGINDNVWIGDSVVDASKLSSQGNRDNFETIVMDELFFNNVKDYNTNANYKYSHYISGKYSYKTRSTVY